MTKTYPATMIAELGAIVGGDDYLGILVAWNGFRTVIVWKYVAEGEFANTMTITYPDTLSYAEARVKAREYIDSIYDEMALEDDYREAIAA